MFIINIHKRKKILFSNRLVCFCGCDNIWNNDDSELIKMNC